MIEIVNYCKQERRYGDSKGKCVLLLEDGDNAEEIIKVFTKKREWYEKEYSNPKIISRYEHSKWDGSVEVFEGKLIEFDTFREYLD